MKKIRTSVALAMSMLSALCCTTAMSADAGNLLLTMPPILASNGTQEEAKDCNDVPGGTAAVDACGVCDGDGSSCTETTCSTGPQTVNYAGREWQRCDDGQWYDWDDAKTYCSELSLAGGGWRLPTQDELRSLIYCSNGVGPIVNYPAHPHNCGDGGGVYTSLTIDKQFECSAGSFWSSSEYDGDEHRAWSVNFGSGEASWSYRQYDLYVRCVR